MELILPVLLTLGFVIVASIDTIQKRREFLAEFNKPATDK